MYIYLAFFVYFPCCFMVLLIRNLTKGKTTRKIEKQWQYGRPQPDYTGSFKLENIVFLE